jgi:hypothetical protein
MIAGLVLGLLADVVFESAASMSGAFSRDLERYFRRRGLVSAPKPTRSSAR